MKLEQKIRLEAKYDELVASWYIVDTKHVEVLSVTRLMAFEGMLGLLAKTQADYSEEDYERYYDAIVAYNALRSAYLSHKEAMTTLRIMYKGEA